MATNAAFLTAIRAMFVQGVTQHFREPPRQVTTAQLPAAFPLMPSGALGEKVLSCWNTNKTRSIQYIAVIEPVGQGTQSQNYDRLADMMDKLEVALDNLEKSQDPTDGIANFIEYDIGAEIFPIGDNDYWAIVATVNARDV